MKIEPKVENPAESECEHAVSATFFLGCLNFKTDRDCALFHNNLPQYDCTNFGFFGFDRQNLVFWMSSGYRQRRRQLRLSPDADSVLSQPKLRGKETLNAAEYLRLFHVVSIV